MDSSFLSHLKRKEKFMPEPNNTPLEKETKGKAKLVERFTVWDLLFAGDIKTAWHIAVKEVLGPKLQNMIAEFSDTVIRSFVYGSNNYKSSYGSDSTKMNYRVISNNNQLLPASQSRGASRYDAITIEFDSYVEAQDAREYVQNYINNYGSCSVLRILAYKDISTIPNDDYYGWTNIDSASITPAIERGKYRLNLPKPMELERGKR